MGNIIDKSRILLADMKMMKSPWNTPNILRFKLKMFELDFLEISIKNIPDLFE